MIQIEFKTHVDHDGFEFVQAPFHIRHVQFDFE